MPISQAKVKSVTSGDTLILTSVNNPNQERTLSLAFVSAPRLRKDGDEVRVHSFSSAYDSTDYISGIARSCKVDTADAEG